MEETERVAEFERESYKQYAEEYRDIRHRRTANNILYVTAQGGVLLGGYLLQKMGVLPRYIYEPGGMTANGRPVEGGGHESVRLAIRAGEQAETSLETAWWIANELVMLTPVLACGLLSLMWVANISSYRWIMQIQRKTLRRTERGVLGDHGGHGRDQREFGSMQATTCKAQERS